jgi:hypothetical protein
MGKLRCREVGKLEKTEAVKWIEEEGERRWRLTDI